MLLHTANIEICTHCDLRCPDCCAGVGMHRVLQHHPWEYFERAAQYLRGIDRVHLSGGEPTLHPQFAEFLPKFRNLFGCRVLTMVTNGYAVEKYAPLIAECCDWVNFSEYHIGRNVPQLLRAHGCHVNIEDWGKNAGDFVPRIKRTSGLPCTRACFRCGGFGYADGKLYGCSVAPGIAGSAALEPCDDWRDKLEAVPLPCAECWFAE